METSSKRRRMGRLVIAVLGVVLMVSAGADIRTMGEAINKAGRQRMLTQRIVKDYCMLGTGVDPERARQQLQASVALFETQLAELAAFAPNDEIRARLEKVKRLWEPFRAAAMGAVDREGAATLLESDDALLAAAHAVVLSLEDASGTQTGRLVNVAGRQRMLSQRMAKFYICKGWGFDGAAQRHGLQQARNEFEGALTVLKEARENTPEIDRKLHQAEKQWKLFRHGLENEKAYIPLLVARSADKLLAIMNDATGLYAHLDGR